MIQLCGLFRLSFIKVDWLMGWLVCEQSRLLAVSYTEIYSGGIKIPIFKLFSLFQSSKVFIKKAIKWVPVIGKK